MPQKDKSYDYQLDKIEGRLFEHITVNGTEMALRWNAEFDTYTLYFPAMDLKDHPMDPDEEVIEIGSDEGKAKEVFGFAKKLASSEGNVHELYRKVGMFARSLDLKTPNTNVEETRTKISHLDYADRNENEAAAAA